MFSNLRNYKNCDIKQYVKLKTIILIQVLLSKDEEECVQVEEIRSAMDKKNMKMDDCRMDSIETRSSGLESPPEVDAESGVETPPMPREV